MHANGCSHTKKADCQLLGAPPQFHICLFLLRVFSPCFHFVPPFVPNGESSARVACAYRWLKGRAEQLRSRAEIGYKPAEGDETGKKKGLDSREPKATRWFACTRNPWLKTASRTHPTPRLSENETPRAIGLVGQEKIVVCKHGDTLC